MIIVSQQSLRAQRSHRWPECLSFGQCMESGSNRCSKLSLAGAATSIIFVATNTRLPRQTFCRDKIFSSRQNICRDKYLSLQTQTFCRGKSFVATSILLSRQKTCFVATKMILVAYLLWHTFVATKLCLSRQK